jgi:MoxR-like ATPase
MSSDKSDAVRLSELAEACTKLRSEIEKAVVGQEQVIEQLLIAIFAGGHALLVGVPGLAKTLLVSSLARSLDLSFGRVQFTPDLLPADITGTDVLHEVERDGRVRYETEFLRGPIFANLVLADEINRTPPKTQAALLQAMQEGTVTVGGKTHALPRPFQVLATQNPIEQEGTYPLPEAQLDRFLLEIRVGYPSAAEEREIARRTSSAPGHAPEPALTVEQVKELSDLVPRIPVTEEAVERAVSLVRSTRPEGSDLAMVRDYVRFGAGPRGSRALLVAAKARAAIRGQAAADVDDVEAMLLPCLRHRLVLSYRAESDRVGAEQVLERVLGKALPR